MTTTNSSTKICAVEGCLRELHCREMCKRHYEQLRTTGRVGPESIMERFMRRVVVDKETGAWQWVGHIDKDGYGHFNRGRRGDSTTAHRAAWELFRGPIPPGMYICHKFENLGRHNVNPDHLFVGSQDDNMKDAAAKKRMRAGESSPKTKLTREQVLEAVASTESTYRLGKKFGVSAETIRQVRIGKAWSHVTGIRQIK